MPRPATAFREAAGSQKSRFKTSPYRLSHPYGLAEDCSGNRISPGCRLPARRGIDRRLPRPVEDAAFGAGGDAAARGSRRAFSTIGHSHFPLLNGSPP